MTVSFWQHAHHRQAATYDVVVVGGGIVGCSVAYWLHRRNPSMDVGVFEAETLGAGASGRNAGFVLQGTHTDYVTDVERYGRQTARRLWHFTRANRNLLASELNGSAFDWHSEGSFTVAGGVEEDERLQASVPLLRTAGAPVVYLEPDEVNERLQATKLYGGLYVTTGAVVNPLLLVRYLADKSGADVHTQQPVEEIRWKRKGAVLETPNLRVRARQVVLTLGASLPTLIPALSDYLRPVRAQMLATAPSDTTHIPVPVYSHEGEFYLRQLENGTVLVGGGRHHHRAAEETDVDTTTPAVQATIERYLHTHFPWTQPLSIQQRWSGTMAFSPDGRPVVGAVPGHPRGLFATGFTGHGMGYGFRMGRLLANLVCGNDRPRALDLFSVSRFKQSEPSTAESKSASDQRGSQEA